MSDDSQSLTGVVASRGGSTFCSASSAGSCTSSKRSFSSFSLGSPDDVLQAVFDDDTDGDVNADDMCVMMMGGDDDEDEEETEEASSLEASDETTTTTQKKAIEEPADEEFFSPCSTPEKLLAGMITDDNDDDDDKQRAAEAQSRNSIDEISELSSRRLVSTRLAALARDVDVQENRLRDMDSRRRRIEERLAKLIKLSSSIKIKNLHTTPPQPEEEPKLATSLVAKRMDAEDEEDSAVETDNNNKISGSKPPSSRTQLRRTTSCEPKPITKLPSNAPLNDSTHRHAAAQTAKVILNEPRTPAVMKTPRRPIVKEMPGMMSGIDEYDLPYGPYGIRVWSPAYWRQYDGDISNLSRSTNSRRPSVKACPSPTTATKTPILFRPRGAITTQASSLAATASSDTAWLLPDPPLRSEQPSRIYFGRSPDLVTCSSTKSSDMEEATKEPYVFLEDVVDDDNDDLVFLPTPAEYQQRAARRTDTWDSANNDTRTHRRRSQPVEKGDDAKTCSLSAAQQELVRRARIAARQALSAVFLTSSDAAAAAATARAFTHLCVTR